MNKTQGNNQAFFDRSGSFSTHGSRSGVNLLGWGEDEVLTDEQKRDALIASLKPLVAEVVEINKRLKTCIPRSDLIAIRDRRVAVCKQISEKNESLSAINKALSRYRVGDNLEHHIIQVVKSKMTKPQWECIMSEARALFSSEGDGS